MVPAETIVQRAIEEKADMIGLSGLITPSLDEMVHVAMELEKAGLDIPLLIGGATTSPLHTALKIAPVYHAPVVHLKDASQNASIAARLMNPNQKEELAKNLFTEYQRLREKNQERQVETVSLEEAKANRLKLFLRFSSQRGQHFLCLLMSSLMNQLLIFFLILLKSCRNIPYEVIRLYAAEITVLADRVGEVFLIAFQ